MRIVMIAAVLAVGALLWQQGAAEEAVAGLCDWDNSVVQWKAGCP